jgi:hypothetical protein
MKFEVAKAKDSKTKLVVGLVLILSIFASFQAFPLPRKQTNWLKDN